MTLQKIRYKINVILTVIERGLWYNWYVT